MKPIQCLFIALSLLSVRQVSAQVHQDLSGSWTGLLLQNEGGFSDRFELYFDIEQIGISLRGTAFVKLGALEAEMKLSGYQTASGSWRITETEILRNNKAGLAVAWCMKEYELWVDYQKDALVLTGPWWGSSEYGPCVPGSITLKRRVKVASLFFRRQNPVDIEAHRHIHHGYYALHGGFAIGGNEHAVSPSGLLL